MESKRVRACAKCKTQIDIGIEIVKRNDEYVHKTCPPRSALTKLRKGQAQMQAEAAQEYWEAEYRRCGRRN